MQSCVEAYAYQQQFVVSVLSTVEGTEPQHGGLPVHLPRGNFCLSKVFSPHHHYLAKFLDVLWIIHLVRTIVELSARPNNGPRVLMKKMHGTVYF